MLVVGIGHVIRHDGKGTSMEELPIWVSAAKQGNLTAEASFTPGTVVALEQIPVQRLRENLGDVCHALTSILEDVRGVGKFRLQEVTVHVEISHDGEVNLVATPARGSEGAITLTFAE